MAAKRQAEVLYKDFCDWYFSDLGRDGMADIVQDLVDSGSISVQGYADSLGYLPANLVQNRSEVEDQIDENEEINAPNVLLIHPKSSTNGKKIDRIHQYVNDIYRQYDDGEIDDEEAVGLIQEVVK